MHHAGSGSRQQACLGVVSLLTRQGVLCTSTLRATIHLTPATLTAHSH